MFNWLNGKGGKSPYKPAHSTTDSSLDFLEGAYRLHRSHDIEQFTALAVSAFPAFSKRIRCFASSWLGYQFASDEARVVKGERQVLLLDPGAGEALEIPIGLGAFHSDELRHRPEAALAFSFYRQWLASGGRVPTYEQCVGYRVPLFLGGADVVENLEMVDFAVYWHLSAQILERTRPLSGGTPINRVSIED